MGVAIFRTMPWLGPTRARAYLGLLAAVQVGLLAFLIATSANGIDRNGFLLGTDFISFWTSGRMLQAGQNVYDGAAHIAAQRTYFATQDGYTAFFYPPGYLFVCWPLGLLGYFPALAAWLLITGGAYLAAVRAWLRACPVGMPLWLLFAGFPPVLITITHGQSSFLVAALIGGGMLLARRNPLAAGVLLGLATIKPQLGVLVPIALLASREWRTIAFAGLTTLALAALAALAFGADVWALWLEASGRAQGALVGGDVGYAKMVSPFAAAMLLGAPSALAWAVQAVVTLAVGGVLAWLALARGWGLGIAASTLAGTALATPFVLDYDLVLLAFPLAWLTAEGLRDGWRHWEKLAVAVAFVAPLIARPLAISTGVPIIPLAVGLLFAVVVRRAARPKIDPTPGA